MSYFIKRRDVEPITHAGVVSYPMLTHAHGCVNGFSSGITCYTATEYLTPGVHDDQEGFVVIAGRGWAKVGDEEYYLEPDTCFIAPAGVAHALKRDPDVPYIKVGWFHGAIR